jgi:hypothetical protein
MFGNSPKVYITLNNGGETYKVSVFKNEVRVEDLLTSSELSIENPKRVFVGRSPRTPMTLYSGGYGPKFDGNSILLEVGHLRYVYIGSEIFGFKSKSPIVYYQSDVGNNGVPYPYAVDSTGAVYFMIKPGIILPFRLEKLQKLFMEDPYEIYFDHSDIAKTAPLKIIKFVEGEKPITNKGIKALNRFIEGGK